MLNLSLVAGKFVSSGRSDRNMTLQEAFASHVEECPCPLPEPDSESDPPLQQARIGEEELVSHKWVSGSNTETYSQSQACVVENRCPDGGSSKSNEEPPPGKKAKVSIEVDKPSPPAVGYTRCDNCGEDLPSEYFSEHADFHLAQELHRTLNTPPAASPTCKSALPSGSSPLTTRKRIKTKNNSTRTRTNKTNAIPVTNWTSTGPSGARTKQIHAFFNRLPSEKDSS